MGTFSIPVKLEVQLMQTHGQIPLLLITDVVQVTIMNDGLQSSSPEKKYVPRNQ